MRCLLVSYLALVTFAVSPIANAKVSDGEALSACRERAASEYGESVRTKLAKIRNANGGKKVMLRVYTDDRRFLATCIVNGDRQVVSLTSKTKAIAAAK